MAPDTECRRRESSPSRGRYAERRLERLTRNARAISSVVSAHTSRSVSATCASKVSAGWQHVKISRSRSSSTASSLVSAASAVAALRRSAISLERRIEARAPAHPVDRLETSGRDEPRPRVGWQTVARPLLDGGRKRVVHRLFRDDRNRRAGGSASPAPDASRRGRRHRPSPAPARVILRPSCLSRLPVFAPSWLSCESTSG